MRSGLVRSRGHRTQGNGGSRPANLRHGNRLSAMHAGLPWRYPAYFAEVSRKSVTRFHNPICRLAMALMRLRMSCTPTAAWASSAICSIPSNWNHVEGLSQPYALRGPFSDYGFIGQPF